MSERGLVSAGMILGLWVAMGQAQAPSSQLANEMLAAHNAARARVGVPKLAWSEKLAEAAQKWADKLVQRGQLVHQKGPSTGENLFQVEGIHATPENVVHDWAAESLDYNQRTNRCTAVCGHYTQMVWRSTKEVGCAVATDGRREVWVCEYSPPGNVVGQRPY